jgi:hypothetical protein
MSAGCGRLTGEETRSSESVAVAGAHGPPASAENVTTDPATLALRSAAGRPPIGFDESDSERSSPHRPDAERSFHAHRVLDSASMMDRLTMDDDEAAAAVSSFVSETDFGGETLYLETVRIRECFRLRLCYVTWEPDEIGTDYTLVLRPYDERCAADGHVYESRLIRIPAALDADTVSGYGSSIGSGGKCGGGGRRGGAESGSGSAEPTTGQSNAQGEP